MRYFFNPLGIRNLLGVTLLIFLVSCDLIPTPTPPPPEDDKGPKDLTPCSDESLPNWYAPLESYRLTDSLYEKFPPTNTGSFDEALLQTAQLDAFMQLVNIVKKLTTSEDISISAGNLGNQYFVRLTLTFVSPEVIEIVLLNHYWSEAPLSKEEVTKHLNEKMISLRDQNELVFLMTITSSYTNPSITDPNAIILKTNVDETKLLDAHGELIKPTYFDPYLGQDNYVSRGHLSGFVTYPMFVNRNKKCTETLNREHTNLMTLQVGNFVITESDKHPITLALRFRSLLDVENSYKLDPNLDPNSFTMTKIQPQNYPPQPGVPEPQYWQEMAKYVWWLLASP